MKLNTDLQLVKTLDLPFDVYTVTKEMIAGTTAFKLNGPLRINSYKFSFNAKTKREMLDLSRGNGTTIPVTESMGFEDTMVFTTYRDAEEQMRHMCEKTMGPSRFRQSKLVYMELL